MPSQRHYIADRNLEIAAGLGAIILGAFLLRDAYDARGRKQPRWLKVATVLP